MANGEVLVVDDTIANLEVVSQVLEDAGYDVATALDGDRALKLVGINPPDLILLDIQMPGIDGFETCERLKQMPEIEAIPVIFMTALSDPQSKMKGFDLGAVDYITKPFQQREFLARVKTHVLLYQLNKNLESRIEERTGELHLASAQLHDSQLQLLQNEKMSALGNMVAGIAHEINNPLAFINSSIKHASTYVEDLLDHLELYQEHHPSPHETIKENAED
ncbi:MAG: response regulator, partial [Cyanobacteria bacterium J06598_3]